jgi:hypothetical protein
MEEAAQNAALWNWICARLSLRINSTFTFSRWSTCVTAA